MKKYIKIFISTFFLLTGFTKIYYLIYNPHKLDLFYSLFSNLTLIYSSVIFFIIVDFIIAFFIFLNNFLKRIAIILAYLILLGGIFISVFEILYKINSNCGCGIPGNVYWQLSQKLFLLIILVLLNLLEKNSKTHIPPK